MTHNLPRCLVVSRIAISTLCFTSYVANAQTVLYDDGFATGIRNLRVNNLCYDVEFVDGSYQSVFADAPPTFLDQPLAANAAANEIRDALNSRRIVPEINESDNEVLWVPNDRVSRAEFQASQVGHDASVDPWKRFGDFQGPVSTDFDAWDFARFSAGPAVIYADNTGHAVGIHNLNIDGTCIDVRFADGSYEDVYAEYAPRYMGLERRANNAANEIMALLNAQQLVPEINDSDNEVLWIPTDRTRPRFQAEQVGHDTSTAAWQRYGDFSGAVNVDFAAWDFAVFNESLDCNRDGIVDVRDMNCACGSGLGEAILAAIDSLPGDLDGNGSVTFADFLQLSGNFGEAGDYTDGDLNCDGLVAFADFLILSGNFGSKGVSPGASDLSAVPEASGMGLFAVSPIALLALRRRRSPAVSGK